MLNRNMADKQSTGRITDEMDEIIRELHPCRAQGKGGQEKYMKRTEGKTKYAKSFE